MDDDDDNDEADDDDGDDHDDDDHEDNDDCDLIFFKNLLYLTILWGKNKVSPQTTQVSLKNPTG